MNGPFRHQGKERLLERRCGTTAYCAPEMLMKPRYNAEPSDIWSCGIVLVAMVTGGKFKCFIIIFDRELNFQLTVLGIAFRHYEFFLTFAVI